MAASNYGLSAVFDTAADVMSAATKVRDAGFKNWDVITPFPMHGLDGAMGVKRSILPRFSFIGGLCGFTTGMSLIWFTGAHDYKLIVGGKPYFSPMFAFPVSYELTILFTAFATIIGMFVLNRLPMHYHAVMKSPDMVKGMDDKFLVIIESRDPKFSLEATKALLTEIGGHDVKEMEA